MSEIDPRVTLERDPVAHIARLTIDNLERKNAYAVLWQDIVERRAKQKSVLARGGKGLDMKAWPAPGYTTTSWGVTRPSSARRMAATSSGGMP